MILYITQMEMTETQCESMSFQLAASSSQTEGRRQNENHGRRANCVDEEGASWGIPLLAASLAGCTKGLLNEK